MRKNTHEGGWSLTVGELTATWLIRTSEGEWQ